MKKMLANVGAVGFMSVMLAVLTAKVVLVAGFVVFVIVCYLL